MGEVVPYTVRDFYLSLYCLGWGAAVLRKICGSKIFTLGDVRLTGGEGEEVGNQCRVEEVERSIASSLLSRVWKTNVTL